MKFKSNAIFDGLITANQVNDAGVNTGKFVVLTSSGVIAYRTAAELLSDIGAASTNQGVPAGGTAGQILAKIDGTDYNDTWIDNYTEQLRDTVKASVAVNKGQAVYISGANGTNQLISLASNASESTSSKTLGLAAQNFAINDIGQVITEGLLSGLDTSTATAGDPVWLGTNGNLIFGLVNKPTAPAHLVSIGVVTRVNASNGEIYIKVQNGFEMGELHNYAEGSVQNNQVIVYESATSLYKPKSIATILGYTPASAATTLTINDVTYDLSANRSWTISSTSVSTRVVQKFTADGSSATYTITGGYTVGMVDVYVNGIKLDNASGVEFTATNGTTVVLVSTPASGDIVEVYKYGSQFIANNALRQKTLFTATAGQTTFTVTYSVGMVDVFYNGSKLDDTEYTATNGTSIVFNTACLLNDKIEVIAYSYTVGAFTGVGGSGTTNYITKFTAAGTIGNSLIYDDGTNVGIGTTSLANYFSRTFTLDGASSQGIMFRASGSDKAYMYWSSDFAVFGANTGGIIFKTADTERMRITSTGNVLIGTTSDAGTGKLQVVNSSAGWGGHITNGSGQQVLFAHGGGYGLNVNAGSNASSSTYLAAFVSNGLDRFYISGDGKVGIGTTSPAVLLDINTGALANNGYNGMRIADDVAHYWFLARKDGSGNRRLAIYNGQNNYPLTLQEGGSGVAIGAISNYGRTLYVLGAGTTSATWNTTFDNSAGTTILGLRNDGAINTGSLATNFTTGSGANMYVDPGNGYIYRSTSSLKYKKNVEDYTKGLAEVMQLRAVSYKGKSEADEGKIFAGLIAEEVHDLGLTEFVQYAEDGSPDALYYQNMIALLVKGMQEQQAQIDNLIKLIN